MGVMMMGHPVSVKFVVLNVLNAIKKQMIVLSVPLEDKIHLPVIVQTVSIHLLH
jgi:hypothetical protein